VWGGFTRGGGLGGLAPGWYVAASFRAQEVAKGAQGKGGTSAVLGGGCKMVSFPFSKSGLAPKGFEAKPDLDKGKAGCVLGLTQGGSRSAPLPWAEILLPFQGDGKANQTCQPTPGARLAASRSALARRG
jgi:hypothetical protein